MLQRKVIKINQKKILMTWNIYLSRKSASTPVAQHYIYWLTWVSVKLLVAIKLCSVYVLYLDDRRDNSCEEVSDHCPSSVESSCNGWTTTCYKYCSIQRRQQRQGWVRKQLRKSQLQCCVAGPIWTGSGSGSGYRLRITTFL